MRYDNQKEKEFLWTPAILCGTEHVSSPHRPLPQASALLSPLPGFSSHFSVCPLSLPGLFLNAVLSERLSSALPIILTLLCSLHRTYHHLTYYVFNYLCLCKFCEARESVFGSMLYQQHLELYLSLCRCSVRICGMNE